MAGTWQITRSTTDRQGHILLHNVTSHFNVTKCCCLLLWHNLPSLPSTMVKVSCKNSTRQSITLIEACRCEVLSDWLIIYNFNTSHMTWVQYTHHQATTVIQVQECHVFHWQALAMTDALFWFVQTAIFNDTTHRIELSQFIETAEN